MLTLIVPGLIWPHQALTDLTRDLTQNLALPAFTTLLGRGRLTRWPPRSTHDRLADALGLSAPLPAAALRGLALGAADRVAADDWLCLDPVHLRFDQNRLLVDNPRQLALNGVEAEQFAVSLAPVFAAFGELQVLAPQTWNLRLASAPPLPPTPPLPDSIARAAIPLPPGAAWAAWRQAINEAQMVLHSHPVNQAREAAGQAVVNSLWPWGHGRLPQPAANAHDALWSNDPVAQGAAQLLGMQAVALPACFARQSDRAPLAIVDILEQPARSGDAQQWREQLVRLETDWLAPLHEALRHGRLDRLHLIAPGETATFELDFRRRDAWKFWRKPAAPTALAAPRNGFES